MPDRDRPARVRPRLLAALLMLFAFHAATATAQSTDRTMDQRVAGKAEAEVLTGRLVEAWRRGDLGPLRASFDASVLVQNLNFDDARCRRRFRRDRVVRRRDLSRLATCLGSLRFAFSDAPAEIIEPFDERYSVFLDDPASRLELGVVRVRGALRVARISRHPR